MSHLNTVTGIIFSVIIHVTSAVCNDNRISKCGVFSECGVFSGAQKRAFNVVGLFKPFSYQTTAVQLALNDINMTDQVCFEPQELSSIAPWIESELVMCQLQYQISLDYIMFSLWAVV